MTDVFHRPVMVAAIGVAIALVTGLLWLALASLHEAPMHQRSATIHEPAANAQPIPAQLMPAIPGARAVTGHPAKP
jgi:hypothetical protein